MNELALRNKLGPIYIILIHCLTSLPYKLFLVDIRDPIRTADTLVCSTGFQQDFLIGIHFTLRDKSQSLVPLLGTKYLDELPARIQRMRLRLMQFTYSCTHCWNISIHSCYPELHKMCILLIQISKQKLMYT